MDEIEATGLRYTSTLDGATQISGWRRVGKPTGMDLMTVFTKDFGTGKDANVVPVRSKYLELMEIQPLCF